LIQKKVTSRRFLVCEKTTRHLGFIKVTKPYIFQVPEDMSNERMIRRACEMEEEGFKVQIFGIN